MFRLAILSCLVITCVHLAAVKAATGGAVGARLPVPSNADRSAALETVVEVFRGDYAAAQSDDERQSLAKKMVEVGQKTKDDLAARFVLFRVARDIALQAGDIDTANLAVQAMACHFNVDGLKLEFDAVKQAAAAPLTRDQRVAVITAIDAFYQSALASERYAAAEESAALAVTLVTPLRDIGARNSWIDRQQKAKGLKETFAQVEAALALLQEDDEDAHAHLVIGKYLCFVRGDWASGLPHLKRCGEPVLERIAAKELAGKASVEQATELGDAWWELAGTVDENEREPIKARAAEWYVKALPGQTGLAKVRIEKRLKESSEQSAEGNPVDMPANSKVPSGAVRFRGHRYFVYTTALSPKDAEKYCNDRGGYLARIESEEEQRFVLGLLSTVRPTSPQIWIGGSDEKSEGDWVFSDGSPLRYSNWSPGSPNNRRGNEDYVCILWFTPKNPSLRGRWDDKRPHTRAFVCEWSD